VTLDNGTDRQTDRRTDRVRRNMRPPPREEGRIISVARKPETEDRPLPGRRLLIYHYTLTLTHTVHTTEQLLIERLCGVCVVAMHSFALIQ